MNTSDYATIASNKIYRIRQSRPKKFYSLPGSSSPSRARTYDSNGQIHPSNTSTILQEYEQSLKNEIQFSQIKELQRSQRKKAMTIQALREEQRQSRVQSRKLLSDLQSIKYRLKTIGLEKQSDLNRKERAILLKHTIDAQNNNHSMMPNPSAPLHYPYLMPHYPHNYPQMSQSQIYAPQNYNRNLSQPIRTNTSKHTPSPLSQNDSTYSQFQQNQKQFKSKKPNQKMIITKNQFNRSKFKKRINEFKRFQNKDDTAKRLRKCFLAVYFTVVLRRSYLKIMKERKKFFLEFWPSEFTKFEQTLKDYFYSKLLPFFKLLKEKQYTSLLPSQDDTKTLQLQKKRTVRQLVKVFFQCLKPFKTVQNLGKVAWGFCSHGSFADDGVLTVSELQFVSFNATHGYLRMDSFLQKSQIISFIFIKIIIFQFLLHPWKKWQKQFNPQENKLLIDNVKLVGSILYDLFVQLQDDYLSQANLKAYPINNYQQVKQANKNFNVEFSKPLLYQTKTVENEIISGLYSQEFIKKKIGLKKILPYIDMAKEVVEGIHQTSKQYNQVFRSKVLKFVPKVNYKY